MRHWSTRQIIIASLTVLLIAALNIWAARLPHPITGGPLLAFVSNQRGSSRVFFAEGGHVRWDAPLPGDGSEAPAWSPDGSQLAFSAQYPFPHTSETTPNFRNMEIWVVNADGTGLHPITTDPGPDMLPRWSPYGDRIAFITRQFAGANSYMQDLALTDPTNPNAVRVTRESGNFSSVSWSPDGTQLAVAYGPQGQSLDVYIVDTTNRLFEMHNITNRDRSWDSAPAWSPAGHHIAYITDSHPEGNALMVYEISSGVEALAAPGIRASGFAWSPDGTKIVVAGWTGNRKQDLFMVDLSHESWPTRRLTFSPESETTPAWSPDGSQIAYVYDTRIVGRFVYSGKCELHLLDLDTGVSTSVRHVTEGTCDAHPTWQPQQPPSVRGGINELTP